MLKWVKGYPRQDPSTGATTFRISNKTAMPVLKDRLPQKLHNLRKYAGSKFGESLQTSNFPEDSYFSRNGFIKTVVGCYNMHHNLIIRPDDVWAAIMTQFSFYINKHAEEFRGKFVNFEGKKELSVTVLGSLRNAPYYQVVKLMSKEIDRNLVDPEVKRWILPSFSTTTDNDLVTVGVIFMATMKEYFEYKCYLMCGIPSVTLEGTVDDWKEVHKRLDRLKEYKLGDWYDMLEPILKQFVDVKEGKVDLDFWQRICDYQTPNGSGQTYLSGWITAFCVFDKDGEWQAPQNPQGKGKWFKLDIQDIPTGIVEVDIKIDDNGTEQEAIMFAGHLAAEIKEDGCTIQPALGWVIALKRKEAETDKRKTF